MKYVTVSRPFLTGPALGASNAALGAWLRLMSFASENGRESEYLPKFKSERESMIAAGVTLEDITEVIAAGLAELQPDGGIKLEGFDHEGLEKVERRRETGKKNGAKGGAPRRKPPKDEAPPATPPAPKLPRAEAGVPTLEDKPATGEELSMVLARHRKNRPPGFTGRPSKEMEDAMVLQIRKEQAGLGAIGHAKAA